MPIVKGPVRARDLRANIAEHGFEVGVLNTVEHLLEEHVMLRQHMRELTDLVDQCIDQVTHMVHVSGAMREQMQKLRREDEQGDAANE